MQNLVYENGFGIFKKGFIESIIKRASFTLFEDHAI